MPNLTKRATQGYMLLEALIAMAILSVIIQSLLQSLSSGSRMINDIRLKAALETVCESAAEHFKALWLQDQANILTTGVASGPFDPDPDYPDLAFVYDPVFPPPDPEAIRVFYRAVEHYSAVAPYNATATHTTILSLPPPFPPADTVYIFEITAWRRGKIVSTFTTLLCR